MYLVQKVWRSNSKKFMNFYFVNRPINEDSNLDLECALLQDLFNFLKILFQFKLLEVCKIWFELLNLFLSWWELVHSRWLELW